MKSFQSYLVIAPTEESARKETMKLAKSVGVDIEKVSPDVFFTRAAKQEISIDQIREIKSHIYQKPLQYTHKFLVIENAHNATPEAQSSLLKILEEPPLHAILVLEAKNKFLLLPTITSRTVIIQNNQYSPQTAQTILDLSLGAALSQIADCQNPEAFLDGQIIALTAQLLKRARAKSVGLSAISHAIEECAYTKQLISANVNAPFALTNLVFTLKTSS